MAIDTRLRLPTHPDAVAPDFRITDKDTHGFFILTDTDGLIIASARDEYTLVKLSHLVSNPLPDIIASYEDPQGRPLFSV